jgi:hypothetical protein
MATFERLRSRASVGTTCATLLFLSVSGRGAQADGTSEVSENAVEPAPQSHPAAPDDYERTPGGLVHKSCVHEVPSGAVVDENDDVKLDGRTIAHLDPCHYPRYGRNSPPAGLTPTINDNIEAATAPAITNAWGFNWFNEITATVIVPSPPRTAPINNFFWPGLETASGSAVLQPVLIYGQSDAGGGPYWSVGLWYISAAGKETHVGVVRVRAGASITSTVKLHCAANGTQCDALLMVQLNGTEILSLGVHTIEVWQTALKGVLEANGINTCSQFPPGGSTTFTNVHVYMPGPSATNYNDVTSALNWVAVKHSEIPDCGFGVFWTDASNATLLY